MESNVFTLPPYIRQHGMRSSFSTYGQPLLKFAFPHAEQSICHVIMQIKKILRSKELWANLKLRGIIIFYISEVVPILPKSGQACSCHVVHRHRMKTYEASAGRRYNKNGHLNCKNDNKVVRNYRGIYAENAGGRYLSTRFAQNSRCNCY